MLHARRKIFSRATIYICASFLIAGAPVVVSPSILSPANAATCSATNSTFVGDGTNSTQNGRTYYVVTIADTSGCTWSVPGGVSNMDILAVGGGGGGGSGAGYFSSGNGGGGGGGAGEVAISYNIAVSNFSSLNIQIGTGGTGGASVGSGQSGLSGGNGSSTTLTQLGITASGGSGGGGGSSGQGGSGGSSGSGKTGGSGTASSYWVGGSGGSSTTNGSIGTTTTNSGSSIYFSSLATPSSYSDGGSGAACNTYGSVTSTNYGSGGRAGRGALYNGCGGSNSYYSYSYGGSSGVQGIVVIRYWYDQTSTCPMPKITSITPNYGSSDGGQLVTVSGFAFLDATKIYIDDQLINILSNKNEVISFYAPKSSKRDAKVLVNNGCGTNSSIYKYDPDPLVTDYTQNAISTEGGLFSAIGFYLDNASVTLDGLPLELIYSSSNYLTVAIPQLPAGQKQLKITTKFGHIFCSLNIVSPPQIEDFKSIPYIAKGDLVNLELQTKYTKLFRLIGELPDGLELDIHSGVIQGYPEIEGKFNFKISAVNEVGESTKDFTLKVDKATPKELKTNLYFKFRSTELSELSSQKFQELSKAINLIQPEDLPSEITLALGDGVSRISLNEERIEFLTELLKDSGVRFSKVNIIGGSNFRVSIYFKWSRA